MVAELPAQLKVGPYRFDVSVDAAAILDETYASHQAHVGHTDMRKLKIVLDPALPGDQLRETLLHEVLHAVVRTVGLGVDEDAEEQFIRAVSPTLLQTLQDNPAFTIYLLAVEDGTVWEFTPETSMDTTVDPAEA